MVWVSEKIRSLTLKERVINMANNNDKRLVSFINEDCGFLYDINTSLESDKFDWHIH